MKRLLVVLGFILLLCGTAEASLGDWPVVGQVYKIGACLLTDAGALGKIVVTHATQATTEILGVVSTCINYVIDTTVSVLPEPVASTSEGSHVETPQ